MSGRLQVSGTRKEENEMSPLSLYTLTSSDLCGAEEMDTDRSDDATLQWSLCLREKIQRIAWPNTVTFGAQAT